MTRAEARIPQIIEAEVQGKTQIEIAENLGVSRMQVYNDRQTPLYDRIRHEFLDLYIEKIKHFMNSERENIALDATKHMGTILKAGIVKQAHIRTDSQEIKIHLHEFKKTEDTPTS